MSSGAAIFAPPHRKVTSSDLHQKPQSYNENETETSSLSQASFKRTSFVAAVNKIKTTRLTQVLPTSTKILPKVGHKLSDWLEFPTDEGRHSVMLNSFTLPFKWLLFTSKGLAGLPPGSGLRERLCNQSSSLGSVAGLYLVIAISAFLVPPTSKDPTDDLLVDIYGILMFFSAMALTVYICLSLTVMYPLLESLPDFAAYEAYVSLAKRWGGYELYLFNFGCQGTILALLVAARVIYSVTVFLWMAGIFVALYCVAAFMTREFFLAIDPVTSLHMGLTNSRDTLRRAARLVKAIKRRHEEFDQQGEDSRREVRAIHYMDEEGEEEERHERLFRSGFSGAGDTIGDKESRLTDSDRDSGIRSPHLTSDFGGSGTGGRGFGGVVLTAVERKDRSVEQQQQRMNSSRLDELDRDDTSRHEVDRLPSDVLDPLLDTEEEEEEGYEGKKEEEDRQRQQGIKTTHASSSSPETKCLQATSKSRRNNRVLPSLESLFLGGDSRLIIAISSAEGEAIHIALLSQGCRDTEQLLEMLRWQAGDRDNGELDPSKCLAIGMHMRIPLFPFMEVVRFVSQYL